MDLIQQIQKAIHQAFQKVFALTVPIADIRLQPTPKEFVGTHTLVTFPFAKSCQQSPEQIAHSLGEWLKHRTHLVADYNVVKGFLNLCIADSVWLAKLMTIREEENFGYAVPNGQRVVIEFSSPNTNKPLHLGHLRNNFIGHAIATIFQAAGYEVHKVNLVNDRGIHICKSMVAYQHWGRGETPETTGLKGDHLVGKYYAKFEQVYKTQTATLAQHSGGSTLAVEPTAILQEAQTMLQQWEAGDPVVLALWEKMNKWVYQGFATTYQQLGITFDKTYYESRTYLVGKDIVEEGLAKEIFYKKEDGSVWVDLTKDGLDEKLLLRSDGTAVYATQDMGAADLRYQDYNFDQSIYVVGDEQDYHFEVLSQILKKLGRTYAARLVHLSYGMVDLPTGKMKSREGTVVDADNLVETMIHTAASHTQQLGKIQEFSVTEAQQLYHTLALGALKYFLLRVDAKKRLLFDPQASIDFQGDTGPFIQYTYARLAAVLRKAEANGIVPHTIALDADTTLQASERAVINQLSMFPQKIQEATTNLAPSVIAQYALDLSKAFNRLYAALPILHAPALQQQNLRICLVLCVSRTIRQSMRLLGIAVPERM